MKNKKSVYVLLLVFSFLEGGILMAFELLSAKAVTPFFGNSIFVWSAMLSVSLLGLAAGYFCSSFIINKGYKIVSWLNYSIVFTAVFALPMFYFSSNLLQILIDINYKLGIILSAFLFVFFPIFFLGIISPLLIHLLSNNDSTQIAKQSGIVYAVSTFGGFVFTVIFGLYVIPFLGITFSQNLVILFLLIELLILRAYLSISKVNLS